MPVQMPETAHELSQIGFVWFSHEFLVFSNAPTKTQTTPAYLLDCPNGILVHQENNIGISLRQPLKLVT